MNDVPDAANEPPTSKSLRITVVYALPRQQYKIVVQLLPDATVRDAVDRSGLTQRFPELLQRPLTCAIFGRLVEQSTVLQAGDRVEILRPLLIDPKEQRRQTAARARSRGT